MDAVRAMRIGSRFDKLVRDRRAALPRREPVEQPLAHLRAHGVVRRVRPEIAKLVRIAREVEELRAKTFPVNELPFLGAHHHRATLVRASPEHAPRAAESVVEL